MCKKMGIARRLLSLLIALVLTLSLLGNKVQAVSIPMLPYIPPMDSQLFDIMFNSFGLTKPDISDDAKRLEGYWKLLETVAGASAEATKELLQRAFDNARTSRELVIDPEVMVTMQGIMKEALNDGVQYKVSEGYVTETETYNQLLTQAIFARLCIAIPTTDCMFPFP